MRTRLLPLALAALRPRAARAFLRAVVGRRAIEDSTGSTFRTRPQTRSSPPPAPTCHGSFRTWSAYRLFLRRSDGAVPAPVRPCAGSRLTPRISEPARASTQGALSCRGRLSGQGRTVTLNR